MILCHVPYVIESTTLQHLHLQASDNDCQSAGQIGCPGGKGFAEHGRYAEHATFICLFEHHLADSYSEIFRAIRTVLLMVIKD